MVKTVTAILLVISFTVCSIFFYYYLFVSLHAFYLYFKKNVIFCIYVLHLVFVYLNVFAIRFLQP